MKGKYDIEYSQRHKKNKVRFYLQYKTKGNVNPEGYPGVYFCCQEEDFINIFESVTEEILSIQKNMTFWYYDPQNEKMNDEDLLFYLSKMQLFVIPVTSNFVYKKSHARDVEMAYALEYHIPILPLMMESGLEEDFNNVCEDMQFLYKTNSDPTAIPYRKKIERFLKDVLVDRETMFKIREAFDAYVFLSYRKKDRKYVEKVMHLIHTDKICRDVAIWYDEFLTPGENFSRSIEAALEKSSLFVIAVTPDILEDPNYVKDVEYPMAKENNKPILPIELEQIDREEMRRCYDDIPEPVAADHVKEISQSVLTALKNRRVVLMKNDDSPEHLFLIGIAYLYGIEVEKSPEISLQLLKRAADMKFDEAYKKLVTIYSIGDGVKKDYQEAMVWQKRYLEVLENRKKAYDEKSAMLMEKRWQRIERLKELSPNRKISPEEKYDLSDVFSELLKEPYTLWEIEIKLATELINLGKLAFDLGDVKQAKEYYEKSYELRKGLIIESSSSDTLYEMATSQSQAGEMYAREGDRKEAWKRYEGALEISEKLAAKFRTKIYWISVAYDLNRFSRICETKEEIEKAKEYSERALKISKYIPDSKEAWARRILGDSLLSLGEIGIMEKNLEEAKNYCERSLEIYQQLYEELDEIGDLKRVRWVMSDLGSILEEKGDDVQAKEYYEKRVELDLKIFKETETIISQRNLSIGYSDLGSIYEKENKIEEASKYYEKALEIAEKLAEEIGTTEDIEILTSEIKKLKYIIKEEGNQKKEKAFYERYLELGQELADRYKNTIILTEMLWNLGELCESTGEYNVTLKCYKQIILIRQKEVENGLYEKQGEILFFSTKLGRIYESLSEWEKAKEYYKIALKYARKLEEYPRVCYLLGLLGRLYEEDENWSEAKNYYDQALLVGEKCVDETGTVRDMMALSVIMYNLGCFYLKQNMYLESEVYFEKDLKIIEKLIGMGQESRMREAARDTLKKLSDVNKLKGDLEKAFEFYRRATELEE